MTTQKLRVSSLDYADIRQSFIDYLKTTAEFSDYNFNASGISVLLDLLAYNAHYQSLQANFLANECYLDTAVRRSSIVSRAKELGYVPKSKRSAKAVVNITLSSVFGNPSSLILPNNSIFTAAVGNSTYNFATQTAYSSVAQYTNSSYTYTFPNVEIYEGLLAQNSFTYKQADPYLTIPNVDIDINTLRVWVQENSTWQEYSAGYNVLNSDNTTKIYFIQEGFGSFYQIYFGDDVIGKQPTEGSSISITYMVTSGDLANSANVFTLTSSVPGAPNALSTTTLVSQSSGGALREDPISVKVNALNQYGTQNRAVVASDYRALILATEVNVKDVHVWGGEDNVPPKFNSVVVCVQPNTGDFLTLSQQQIIISMIQNKAVANTKILFVDPQYLDLIIQTSVVYDKSTITIGTYDLQNLVKATISSYADTNLNKFNTVFRYSNLVRDIDRTDAAILNNQTYVKLIKELIPTVYQIKSYQVSFSNPISNASKLPTLSSTTFFLDNSSLALQLEDNGAGSINIIYYSNSVKYIYKANAGSINYATGEVIINPIVITGYSGTSLQISVVPETTDIATSLNVILRVKSENIIVTTTADKIK